MNTLEFIEKAHNIHGNKYDYSKTEYVNPKTKVCIICKTHGEFYQKPYNHLNGQGCGKCRYELLSSNYRKERSKFIDECKKIHHNKYDYSKVEYKNWKTKVCIICPQHGEFYQTPMAHRHGQGCPKCANEKKVGKFILGNEKFIEKAHKIHGDKYDYSKVEYVKTRQPITIICPTHGEFLQTPENHLQGKGCPMCANNLSKAENSIYEFLCKYIDKEKIIRRDRSVLDGLELDIFIPSMSIAIEYNGLRWHSEEFITDKNYHLNKLKKCNEKGVKLIQIFEDEWIEHKEIVLDKLKHILGFDYSGKVYARKCKIKKIDKHVGHDFLDKNHIQGSVGSTVFLGAFYDDELIAVMSFTNEGNDCWNLTRFATDNSKRCVGVGGKLFKFFLREYNPKYVKSFADRRWTLSEENNLYTNIGFKFVGTLSPDYRYVNKQKREHKFNYRKQILSKKYGLPLTMTETEMAAQLGIHRIWDCGLYKFEWKKL